MSSEVLLLTLEAAVPLWIHRVRSWPRPYREAREKVCAEVIAAEGDNIMFKTKGKTANAFNRLAEGLALLSFVPGGVKFSGLHWESRG